MRKFLFVLMLLVFTLLPAVGMVQAVPGEIDVNFGTDGSTRLNIDPVNLMLDSQGRIVVMGEDRSNLATDALFRLMPNGFPDGTFGSEGRVDIEDFTPGEFVFMQAHNFVVDAFDRVLVAIEYRDSSNWDSYAEFAILRVNTNGSLDTTFGNGGFVRFDPTVDADDYATQIAILPDGKILLAGFKGDQPDYGNVLVFVRFHADGTLDTTYDGDGKVVVTLNADDASMNHLIIDNAGRPVVVGSQYDNAGGNSAIALRLTTEGARDTTFDGDGLKKMFPGYATAVTQDANGRLVIVGHNYTKGMYLSRLQNNGTYDTTIGAQYKHIILSGFSGTSGDVLIDPAGNILASGAVGAFGPETDDAGALIRFKPSGKFDATFGVEGIMPTISNRLRFIAFDANNGVVSVDGVGSVVRNLYQTPAPYELIYNGSFEIKGYYGFIPNGWTFSRYNMHFSGRECDYGLVKRCLLDFDDERFVATQAFSLKSVLKGGSMTLSTWVKNVGTTGARVFAVLKYADGTSQKIAAPVPTSTGNIWRHITITKPIKNVRVTKIQITVAANESRTYYDAVSLKWMPPGGGRSEEAPTIKLKGSNQQIDPTMEWMPLPPAK